eukprot:gene3233-5677_t
MKKKRESDSKFSIKNIENTLNSPRSNNGESTPVTLSSPIGLFKRKSATNLKKLNIEKYTINYESFFIYPKLYQSISDFTCEELKIESYSPLEFIHMTLELKLLSNQIEKFVVAKKIIKLFIEENSLKELALSKYERKQVLFHFENINSIIENITLPEDEIFNELFSKIQTVQFNEILRDVFPRYIRSKKGLTELSNYISDPNVMQTKQQIKYPYTRKDFERQYIIQKDYDFMKSLAKDDLNWELLESINGEMNIFFSDINVLQTTETLSNLNFFKYDIVLPFSFEQVICSITTTKDILEYSPTIKSFKSIEDRSYFDVLDKYPNAEEEILKNKSMLLAHFELKLSFPLTTTRISPLVYSTNYTKTTREEFEVISKPCIHNDILPEKGDFIWSKKREVKLEDETTKSCYYIFNFAYFLYTKLDDKRTMYTQIHIGDFGGWTHESKMAKIALKRRGTDLRKNLIEHIKKKQPNLKVKDYRFELEKDPVGRMVYEAFENPNGSQKKTEKRTSSVLFL